MAAPFAGSAQDLLVTVDGDSINCKITKVKEDYIYFIFSHQGEVRNTLLPREQVTDFQNDFYETAVVQPDQIAGYKSKFPHWRLAASGGWGYRLGRSPDGLNSAGQDFVNQLRSGFIIGLDAGYFFSEIFGAGLKYDLFKAHALSLSPSVEDHNSISFAGPSFIMRFFDQAKANYWFMGYSIGYMGYKDRMDVSGQQIINQGSTFGMAMDFGYDIALSKNWALGFQLSLLSGTLTRYNQTVNGVTQTIELKSGSYEGLGRVNLSAGLRCNF